MASKAKKRPKKARAARPKRQRIKQPFLPGVEPLSDKQLDQATENYYDAIQDRLPYTKAEAEAHDNLQEKMAEKGVDRYETPDGLIAVRVSKSKCSVKRKKGEPETNGESDAET